MVLQPHGEFCVLLYHPTVVWMIPADTAVAFRVWTSQDSEQDLLSDCLQLWKSHTPSISKGL